MIKVFKARINKKYQTSEKEVAELERQGYFFENGSIIGNEQFLFYKKNNGDFVSTIARNSKNKKIDRLPFDKEDGTSVEEVFNLEKLDIIDIIFVDNKKELSKLIKNFNYEKGIDLKWWTHLKKWDSISRKLM